MKGLLSGVSILLAFIFNSCTAPSEVQTSGNADMKALVEGKRYVFQAQMAQPSRGTARQLTGGYELRVSGDTLIAQLPYFGRAYQAPSDMRGGGIDFTSTDYGYSIEPRRKGRWNIAFDLKGKTDVRSMTLSVSEDGYASLQVLSNNREPISFTGVVVKRSGRR
jgi:hypothetical protein